MALFPQVGGSVRKAESMVLEILEVSITPSSNNILGSVKHGYIRAHGWDIRSYGVGAKQLAAWGIVTNSWLSSLQI